MTHPLFILKQIEEQLANQPKNTGIPHYNILELDEETFLIQIAAAGLAKEDFTLTLEKQILTVQYTKPELPEPKYYFKGISNKSFTKDFRLNDFVVVESAEMLDGLLVVTLKKVVPEEMKPKLIPIFKKEVTEPKLLTE